MKMRYLKTFENFGPNDMGRFSNTDSDEQEWLTHIKPEDEKEEEEPGLKNEFEEECAECHGEGCPACKPEDENEEETSNEPRRRKVWGDEVIERKKFNFEKKKGEKKEDKKEDKKAEKKEGKKGLTAGQKKLPEAMQKAILKKQK